MKKLQLYEEGYKLKENEYLLKINSSKGFLTKFTQKGEIPKSFAEWGNWRNQSNQPIYIFEETYREGWKVVGTRIGKSQQWAQVRHPDGFILEIYLSSFFADLDSIDLIKGELIGKFKWCEHHLIKE